MIAIERTFDENFIYDCAQPIWEAISDDGSVSKDLYFPNMSPENYWLEAYEDEVRYGVFLFHPHNTICYEAHTMLLPRAHGRAAECAGAAIGWMFHNTQCQRIITNVPAYNRHALRLARSVRMIEYGLNDKSFLKNGVLYAQHVLGISKGE